MSAFVRLNGARALSFELHVPHERHAPLWTADVALDEPLALSGKVTLLVGSLVLAGAVVPDHSGTYALGARYRIVAGAGGWDKPITLPAYQNDAGLKVDKLAGDVARAAGESIELDAATAGKRRGTWWIPSRRPAAELLAHVLAETPWRVDFDGVARTGPRPSAAFGASVEVLSYDVLNRIAVLGVDDPAELALGAVLTRPQLPRPLRVLALELRAEGDSFRASVWGEEAA